VAAITTALKLVSPVTYDRKILARGGANYLKNVTKSHYSTTGQCLAIQKTEEPKGFA
jgi:tRNA(Leu) C34 or U34 (ribose-2'-O)-methylase TrmL